MPPFARKKLVAYVASRRAGEVGMAADPPLSAHEKAEIASGETRLHAALHGIGVGWREEGALKKAGLVVHADLADHDEDAQAHKLRRDMEVKRKLIADAQDRLKNPPEWLKEKGSLAQADWRKKVEGVVERQQRNLREMEEEHSTLRGRTDTAPAPQPAAAHRGSADDAGDVESAGDVVVRMTRRPHEAWGLRFVSARLALGRPTNGTAAAGSAQLRGCVMTPMRLQ
eukprot:gene28758-10629_t